MATAAAGARGLRRVRGGGVPVKTTEIMKCHTKASPVALSCLSVSSAVLVRLFVSDASRLAAVSTTAVSLPIAAAAVRAAHAKALAAYKPV